MLAVGSTLTAGTRVPAQASPARSSHTLSGPTSLFFEENRGQAHPDIRFLARSGGASLALTRSGAALTFSPPSRPGTSSRTAGDTVEYIFPTSEGTAQN